MKLSLPLKCLGVSTRISTFLCLGTFLLLSTSAAWAQTSTAGTVLGQVLDEQHAIVPGAEVKVVETSTNSAQTTVTNGDGRYVFSQVNPGNYNISFTRQGFATYQVNGQQVDIGQSLTINATLKIGTTATTVEVTASAGAELQTLNATVGNTLSGQALLLLPNIG